MMPTDDDSLSYAATDHSVEISVDRSAYPESVGRPREYDPRSHDISIASGASGLSYRLHSTPNSSRRSDSRHNQSQTVADSIRLPSAATVGTACYVALSGRTVLFDNSTWSQSPLLYCASGALLLSSCIGLGAYVRSRRHFKFASRTEAIVYPAFGSVLFNLGSLTIMTAIRRATALTAGGRLFFGLGAAFVLLTSGKRYLNLVDVW